MPAKIIISGGGTGGHVFPAIAIANALKNIDKSIEILFVGAKNKIEMEKVPQAGYPIEGLWISGFYRQFTFDNVLFPVKLASSLVKSYQIIKQFKPQVAVGVGGYASGALLYMASKLNIPTLIQEQNSYPGITNKLLSKKADVICVAYDGMERFFPIDKMVITGNPIRSSIVQQFNNKQINIENNEKIYAKYGLNANKKTLFVTGGSLGARGINEAILNILPDCSKNNIQILWQTGKLYLNEMKERSQEYLNIAVLQPFIDNMCDAYQIADVIVSRAGAMAIAELSVVAKPTILMPSPNVAENHQTANAIALVKKNATKMVLDSEAKNNLFNNIFELLSNSELAKELETNMKSCAITNAAERIAKETLLLIR